MKRPLLKSFLLQQSVPLAMVGYATYALHMGKELHGVVVLVLAFVVLIICKTLDMLSED